MQKEEIKFVDSTVFEGMTSIRSIIKGIDSGINTRKINEILFDKERKTKIGKELGYLRAISEKYGFKITETDSGELENITFGNTHGGLVAKTSDRILPHLTPDISLPKFGFFVMIEGIEDPYNFGY